MGPCNILYDHGLRLDFELPAQRGIGFVDLDGSLCLKCPYKFSTRSQEHTTECNSTSALEKCFMHIKCHDANAKKEEEH